MGGGVPGRSIAMICGPAGSLKTTLAYSVLYHNARTSRLKGLFISMEQGRESLLAHMEAFGLGPDPGVAIVDVAALRQAIKGGERPDWLGGLTAQLRRYRDEVGFDLLAGGSIRFDFRWSSGDDTYSYLTAQGTLDSGVAATDEGVRVEFTPTGADRFSLDVTPLDGRPTTTLTGELFQSGGIDLLRVFLQADATGVRADAFANRIAVPEPGVDAARTAALVLVLVLALGFRASATRFPRGRSRSGPGAGFPPGSRASPRGAARAG